MTAAGFAYLCAFLTSLAMGVFWVGLPYLVIDWYQATEWHLGLIGGVVAGVRVVTGMIPGRIAGRFRRHHVMAAGAVLLAGSMSLVRVSTSFWFVMGLMVMVGTGLGFFWVALEAYLGEGVGPGELRHRMGWFNVSWSLGDMFGSFLGGGLFGLSVYLANRWGSPGLRAGPCLFSGFLALFISLMVVTRLHSRPASVVPHQTRDDIVPRSPERGGHSSLAVFWRFVFCCGPQFQ